MRAMILRLLYLQCNMCVVKLWCLFCCQIHLPRYVRSTISGHDVTIISERFHARVWLQY